MHENINLNRNQIVNKNNIKIFNKRNSELEE